MSSTAGMMQDPKQASTLSSSSFYSSKTTYLTPIDRKRLRALENESPTDQVDSPAKRPRLRPRKPAPRACAVKASTKPTKQPKVNKKKAAAPKASTSSVIVPLSENRTNIASNDANSPPNKTRKFFSSGLGARSRGSSATAVSWNGKFDLKFQRATARTKSADNPDFGGKKPIVMSVPFKPQQNQQSKTRVVTVGTKLGGMQPIVMSVPFKPQQDQQSKTRVVTVDTNLGGMQPIVMSVPSKPQQDQQSKTQVVAVGTNLGGKKPIVMSVPFKPQQDQQSKIQVVAVGTNPPEQAPSGVTEPDPKTCSTCDVPEYPEDVPSPASSQGELIVPHLEPGDRPEADDNLKSDYLEPDCAPGADIKLKEVSKDNTDMTIKEDCQLEEDRSIKANGILEKDVKFREEGTLKDGKFRMDELETCSEHKAGGIQIKDGRSSWVSASYCQADAGDKVGCSSFKITTVPEDKPSCSKSLIFISAEKENRKSDYGSDDTKKAKISRTNVGGKRGEAESLKGHSFQEEALLDDILPLPKAILTPPKQRIGCNNHLMAAFGDGTNSGGQSIYPIFSTPVCTPSLMGVRCRVTSPIPLQKKFLCNTADPSQLIIDAGQKHFGPVTCSMCSMVYSAGEMEDEKLHARFHQAFLGVLKFPGWKKQREVGVYYDGKIIMVSFSDPKFMLKKMEEIGQMVNRNLGILEPADVMAPPRMYFVFVSNDKKVLGFLVAQQIKEAYRVIPSETREVTCNYLCESTPVPAFCGVTRIWTAPFYRRKKVATRLLDRLRTNFSYGCLVELEKLAFSDPTMMGRTLAAAYTRNDRFLVFR